MHSEYHGQLKGVESNLVKHLIEQMKRGEEAEFTVMAELFNNEDDEDSFTDKLFPTLVTDY